MPLKRKYPKTGHRTLSLSTTNLPNPNSYQIKLVNACKTILAEQYFEQLKLKYAVSFADPNNKFVQNENLFEIDSRTKKEILTLARERRPDAFIHKINSYVSSNRFVGLIVIQSLLELILTIKQQANHTSNKVNHLIYSASFAFENICDNFPPCWSVCSNVYKNLLYSPMDIEIDFKKMRTNNSEGFFRIILAMLENVIKENEEDEQNSFGFDSLLNFQQYERVEEAKFCYSKLSRHDKIDRVFVILNLLIKLMEIDLEVWIQRYPFQTTKVMSNANTVPLIGHLLWNGRDCGQMNIIIRNILKIFTTCIWIHFPEDKIDILARLVNLVAIAVNLSENNQHKNLIIYPNIKSLNETFATEVTASVEAFPYNIEFYTNVISKIYSPIIRLLTTSRVLSKFNRHFQAITLKKIFDTFVTNDWLQYNDNTNRLTNRSPSSDTHYPTYDLTAYKKKPKHLELNRDEYLNLLFHQFESYLDIYHTHDVLQLLLTTEEDSETKNSKEQIHKQACSKVTFEKSQRFDYNKLVSDWRRLESVATKLGATDNIYIPEFKKCQNVYIDASLCLRYQEDIEYIVKLKEIIDKNHTEFGETFKKWHSEIGLYLCFMQNINL